MKSWKRCATYSGKGLRRRPLAHRSLSGLQALEPRMALDADGPLSASDRYFTLSFAPDGADVGGAPNALGAHFEAAFPGMDWQGTILRAFQTWAAETSVDIGVVDEIGTLPFGVQGPRTGDARVGDIRIGARPLAADTLAISVSEAAVLSGTWAADVVFNSAAELQSLDDLFSVALHEAGHVFGISHVDDPSSPMHLHGITPARSLTVDDVAQVRANYGSRLPDVWEQSNGNETIDSATRIEPIEAVDNVTGSGPAIAFGNLHSAADVDVYAIEAIDDYEGPLTVKLNTAGISLLRASLTLTTSDGKLVASLANEGSARSSLQYTIPRVQADDEYVVQIESAVDDVFGTGGYVLSAWFDGALQVSPDQVDAVVRSRLRLGPDELESLLWADDEFLKPDGGRDDSEDDAADLQALSEFSALPRYVVNGSIEGQQDVDVYRLKSPDELAARSVLHASVRSLNDGGLIPRVWILDEDRREVASTVLINGGGELVVQVESVAADREYYVRVGASAGDRFEAGDYRLTVDFVTAPTALQAFAAGAVSGVGQISAHRLYVANPQLFHFGLTTDPAATVGAAGVIMRVIADDGATIHELTSPAGQTRTGGSVFLAPGAYALLASPLYELPADAAALLSYHVIGDTVSDPFAVDPAQPSDAEYQCPDLEGMFCYPGGIVSPDPFIWFEFLEQLPEPPDMSGPELPAALLGDWWSWYWRQQGSNVAPAAQNDEYYTATGVTLVVDGDEGVLWNDADADSNELSVRVLEYPAHGSLSLQFDGSFVYQPDAGFAGSDRFVYEAYDFREVSLPATVAIDVGEGSLRGDFTADGVVDAQDLGELAVAIRVSGGTAFDLSHDQQVDDQDWAVIVREILGTSFGDSDLDGRFDSSDLVAVFQSGQYEDGLVSNSSWETGDWNGDGEFDSSDLVFAFQWGGYE